MLLEALISCPDNHTHAALGCTWRPLIVKCVRASRLWQRPAWQRRQQHCGNRPCFIAWCRACSFSSRGGTVLPMHAAHPGGCTEQAGSLHACMVRGRRIEVQRRGRPNYMVSSMLHCRAQQAQHVAPAAAELLFAESGLPRTHLWLHAVVPHMNCVWRRLLQHSLRHDRSRPSQQHQAGARAVPCSTNTAPPFHPGQQPARFCSGSPHNRPAVALARPYRRGTRPNALPESPGSNGSNAAAGRPGAAAAGAGAAGAAVVCAAGRARRSWSSHPAHAAAGRQNSGGGRPVCQCAAVWRGARAHPVTRAGHWCCWPHARTTHLLHVARPSLHMLVCTHAAAGAGRGQPALRPGRAAADGRRGRATTAAGRHQVGGGLRAVLRRAAAVQRLQLVQPPRRLRHSLCSVVAGPPAACVTRRAAAQLRAAWAQPLPPHPAMCLSACCSQPQQPR